MVLSWSLQPLSCFHNGIPMNPGLGVLFYLDFFLVCL